MVITILNHYLTTILNQPVIMDYFALSSNSYLMDRNV